MQLRDHHEEFRSLGADVVAVATATHHQAEALQVDLPFPVLLDPDFELRTALDLRSRFRWRELVGVDSGRNYISALRRGRRQGMVPPTHARNKPAVLIRRPDGVVAWVHEGAAVGDYPSLETVIEALRHAQDTPNS